MEEILLLKNYPVRQRPDEFGGLKYDPTLKIVITQHTLSEWDDRLASSAHDFAIDTCYTHEIFTSPKLLKTKFNLIAQPRAPFGSRILPWTTKNILAPNGTRAVTAQGIAASETLPIYWANIWIFGNVPPYDKTPIRYRLRHGVTTKEGSNRHLVGRSLLVEMGCRFQIDYLSQSPSLSVWIHPRNVAP